jgi:Ankyrin repeats (3 copies)
MTRTSIASRRGFTAAIASLLLVACQEANTMGIQASPVDTKKFFTDPRLAEFADHIQKGDLAKVQAGLRAGISPNAPGLQGFTPLFFVFPAKTVDVARELLKAGANPNAKLENGTPPLLFAVRLENPAFTQVLLDFKADPNATGPNEKPVIHEAVYAKAPHNIRTLAKSGVNLNVVWGGGTPLYVAIDATSFEAAAALLDLGADVSWRVPKGKVQDTADESFCQLAKRLQPTASSRKPVLDLFAAFERRGVKLPCASEAERFK